MGKIIVTGAEGFIGSNLINYLNEKGFVNLIIVDSVDNGYLNGAQYLKKMTIEEFTLFCITATNNSWSESWDIDAVFHLGAKVDTASRDRRIIDYNLTFSQILFNLCALKDIPIFYTSSAAVYGRSRTFKEDEMDLHTLNIYAESKYLIDKYALTYVKAKPKFWYGFRLFNVYGPNELHKREMASAITQIFLKSVLEGEITLFKSVEPEIKDGYQMRDFIHVKDVILAMYSFYVNKEIIPSGIYNLGTGKAISFLDIAEQIRKSLDFKMNIRFIDTPEEIHESYQSFTQANMEKTHKYLPYFETDDIETSIQNHYDNLKRIKNIGINNSKNKIE
jgi:ADP-L-glycero-D-manno-heptose 6-epimerase